MRVLAAAELLTLWEQGLSQTPLERGLTLVAAACPELSWEQVMQLSIGQRDHRLLTVREQQFGAQLVSVATCGACGEQLELSFTVDQIRLPVLAVPAQIEVQQGDYCVQVRLPNSQDLAALAQWPTAPLPELRRRLLERCLLSPVSELPEAMVEAIATQLATADPQADIQLDLCCPACGQTWQAIFDIGVFLWTEIHAWALRLLREVHILATAYGWSERDILAMSVQRRRWYLDLIG